MSEAQRGSQGPLEESELLRLMRETAQGLRKDWGEVERTLRMDEDMQATARALQRTGPKLARFGELLGILSDQMDEQNRRADGAERE